MEIEIVGVPEFWFRLTDNQMALLRFCSASHYDLTCKLAFHPGGELQLWPLWTSEGMQVRSSFRNLDLAVKIMENPPPGMYHEVKDIDHMFRAALEKAQRTSWKMTMNNGVGV